MSEGKHYISGRRRNWKETVRISVRETIGKEEEGKRKCIKDPEKK